MENYPNDIILKNDPRWREKLIAYQEARKPFNYAPSDFPMHINKRMVAQRENLFNPITQKYYRHHEELEKAEKQNIINTIAKNFDNQLRNEQTFDIVTHKNKLDCFGYFEPYEIDHVKVNKEVSKAPYNIITNISLLDHHYNPPEKRPNVPLETEAKPRTNRYYRDFDIVSNRYHYDNDIKMQTEQEIEKYNAAKNFLKKQKDYDIINCRYYDDEKDKEYQRELEKQREDAMKKYKSQNKLLFNPVNNFVYEPEKQRELDLKEYNKKARYRLKGDIEKYYQDLDYNNSVTKEKQRENRVSYNNYRIIDKRGYDILNGANIYNKHKDNSTNQNRREMKSNWEIIEEEMGENGTIGKKPIYQDPYDATDVDERKHLYLNNRSQMLRSLPLLSSDNRFSMGRLIEKPEHKLRIETSSKPILFDKERWFKSMPRNYHYGGENKQVTDNTNFGLGGRYGNEIGFGKKKYRSKLSLSSKF